jgi:hypothetical protein
MVSFDLSSSTPHNHHHHHHDHHHGGNNEIRPEKTFRVTPHPNKWLDVRGDDEVDDEGGRRGREPTLDLCITNVTSVRITTEHDCRLWSCDRGSGLVVVVVCGTNHDAPLF